MRRKITRIAAGLAAVAALALGGAALAAGQGGSQPAKPAVTPAAAQPVEKMESGVPEKAGVEQNDGSTAADTDSIQDENGKDDATEQAGSEQESTAEAAESGSEVPGNDGPGGHADEPGSPNADHQAVGDE